MNGSCGCPPLIPNPLLTCCPVTNIPGPPGGNAFALLLTDLTVPANTITPVTINMSTTSWVIPGQTIIVGDFTDGHANFVVQSILSPTAVIGLWANNPGDVLPTTVLHVANGANAGPSGPAGMTSNGINAFTTLTASNVIPSDLVSPTTYQVANSQWVTVGQTIVIGDSVDGHGTFSVTAVPDGTHITAVYLNALGDAGFGAPLNTANGATVSPSGPPAIATRLRFMSASTTGTANPATNAESTLITTNVPAGVLVNAGDSVEIEAVFTLASAGNNTVKLYFGATVLVTLGPAAQNSGNLIIRARVVRITNTTQIAYATAFMTTGATFNVVTALATTPTETLSGLVAVKGTGQNASSNAGAVTQTVLMVRSASI